MIFAGVGATLALSACGGGSDQAANEPRGQFSVDVSTASFPSSQRLAQRTHLVIAVRNTSHRTVPNVAVTICNVTCSYPAPKGQGASAGAFAANIGQPGVADPSRPTWIVLRGPGRCGDSCANGGAGAGTGAAATAYSNTWALGKLRPGHTARFDWSVAAVAPGRHTVAWQVAAGLNGRARAVLADGSPPHGIFAVRIRTAPPRTRVTDNGQIVNAQ